MNGPIGYERPPLVTSSDINPSGGFSTLGTTSPAFAALQSMAKAAGQSPILTAAGPAYLPVGSLGLGVIVLLGLAYYIDRRVLR
ncbi:MAG: hypothetical protein ACYDCL_21455 [Myxococcales bacterium]